MMQNTTQPAEATGAHEVGNSRLIDTLGTLIEIFTPMIEEWRKGRPITKLCYGLNNEHMKALDELDSTYRATVPNVYEITGWRRRSGAA